MIQVRWPVLMVFLLLTIFAAYVALAPHPPPPFSGLNERRWLFGIAGDHWLHFGYCCLATSLLAVVLEDPVPPLSIVLGFMLLVSTGSEVLQGLLPWRHFDWYDILANIIGCGAGGALILVMRLLMSGSWQVGKDPSVAPDAYELVPV